MKKKLKEKIQLSVGLLPLALSLILISCKDNKPKSADINNNQPTNSEIIKDDSLITPIRPTPTLPAMLLPNNSNSTLELETATPITATPSAPVQEIDQNNDFSNATFSPNSKCEIVEENTSIELDEFSGASLILFYWIRWIDNQSNSINGYIKFERYNQTDFIDPNLEKSYYLAPSLPDEVGWVFLIACQNQEAEAFAWANVTNLLTWLQTHYGQNFEQKPGRTFDTKDIIIEEEIVKQWLNDDIYPEDKNKP